jgi:ABC-type transport system involved in Fe-S cluster assembly fused permease/ATPase subunit
MDKIQILFHEYDTLRTEVIHRINNMYQLIVGSVALLIWLASKWGTASFCAFLIFSSLVFLFFWWIIYRGITTLNRRLQQLEEEINGLAGEQLLKWETLWSFVVTGYLYGATPKQATRISNSDTQLHQHPK